MQLWNDYEGKTLADRYTLGQLVRPEGRSALFALQNGPEAPAIIRITESLNDEGQMLASWRRVALLNQPNLLTLKHFGETTFAGTPLTYAVLEPTDANLADLLKDRALTQDEALQVATSLVPALAALHAENLVHEHIDASNVFAVGEAVKLRADCVRESIPDAITTSEDCAKAVARDVHDLATLLLHALTLQKRLTPATRLLAPFDQIIPNALNGSWSLAEIARVLAPPAAAIPPAEPQRDSTTSADPAHLAAESPLLYQRRVVNSTVPAHRRVPLPVWAASGIAAILAVGVALHHSKPAQTPAPTAAPPAAIRPVNEPVAPAAAPEPKPSTQTAAAPARVQPGWYVIAYTFNHEEQARKRAAAIVKRYGWLHPEVIAPGGGNAYLIALGGPMSRDQAESTRNRARQLGLPRDTFVRNYRAS